MQRPIYSPSIRVWHKGVRIDVSLKQYEHALSIFRRELPKVFKAIYNREYVSYTGDIKEELYVDKVGFSIAIHESELDRWKGGEDAYIENFLLSLDHMEKSVEAINLFLQSRGEISKHNRTLHYIYSLPDAEVHDYSFSYIVAVDDCIRVVVRDFDIAKKFADYLKDALITASGVAVSYTSELMQLSSRDFLSLCGESVLCRYYDGSAFMKVNILRRLSRGEVSIDNLISILDKRITILPYISRTDLLNKYQIYDEYGPLNIVEDFVIDNPELFE